MDESYTKEELGKLIVDKAFNEIENWAWKQLNLIKYNNKTPLCIPMTTNSWLVGHYKIIKKKKKGFQLYQTNKLVYTFTNKQAAFLFAIVDKLKYYELSRKILTSDQSYARAIEEVKLLCLKSLHYQNNKNVFKKALIDAKLTDAKQKYNFAKKELEKNLFQAKYVKVWD
jgi:hypothetical protein